MLQEKDEALDLPGAGEMAAKILKSFTSKMLWWIIGFLVIFGAALTIKGGQLDMSTTLHHFVRDVGIAILVGAIITAVYEAYARVRFEIMLMNSFLGAVIADWSRQDIWKALKSQIIEKAVVRENFRLAICLQPDQRLLPGQMLLKMQVSYDLRGLRSESMAAKIEHFLDWHFKIKDHNLPCFSRVRIGSKDIPLQSEAFNQQGEFSYWVKVPAKDSGSIPVTTSRQEVLYFPGVNCFVLNEITKGLEICLNGIPDDISAFVTVRTHPNLKYRELKLESADDRIKIDDIVLFPGQIIELLFQPKE
ncbi:MAG: hypothetical protein ACRYGO_02920 [Janthinobacterium lividum]